MKNLYLIIALCLFSVGYAQNPADRDPSFNQFSLPLGSYFAEKQINKTVSLIDGKILFLDVDGKLIKLNENLLDVDISSNLNGIVKDFLEQPDGKIILCGDFTTYQGNLCKKIIRLNTDCSLDNTFNLCSGFETNSSIDKIFLQNDGKLIVTGSFNTIDGVVLPTNTPNVRLSSNGALDTSFNCQTKLTKIVFQSDNKILAIYHNSTTYHDEIIRFNIDGTIDANFVTEMPTISATQGVVDFALQADGKIIIIGKFLINNVLVRVLRLNSDGSTDSTFYNSGVEFQSIHQYQTIQLMKVIIQPNDQILISGNFNSFSNNSSNGIVRLNSDGSFDPTFSIGTGISDYNFPGNSVSLPTINLVLNNNGKIICSGFFIKYNDETVNNIVRINSDGTRDITFNNKCKGFDRTVKLIEEQPDGKIIVAGDFTSYNGITANNIVRLNIDGSIDDTFSSGLGFQWRMVGMFDMLIQPDGKIVFALTARPFNTYNGTTIQTVFRINNNGSLDTSFVTGAFNGHNYHINLQSDGKILVLGNFTTYMGVSCTGLMRLLPDGTKDSSFNFNAGKFYWGGCTYLQPDGKIVYAKNDGQGYDGIFRLNVNGTRDTSFLDGYSGSISLTLFMPDGKFITNDFVSTATRSVVKHNADGSVDTDFYSPILNDANTEGKIELQTDGKLLVLNKNNTTKLIKVIRLNENGSVDQSFNMPIGAKEQIPAVNSVNFIPHLKLLSNGKILMGGDIVLLNNLPENRIVRLNGGIDYYFIQGQSKIDTDNNGGCDNNDAVAPNLKFNVSSGTNNWNYFSNTTGNYNIGFSSGSHTIAPSFENPTYFNVTPSSITVDFPSQASPVIQDFCITANGTHSDLEVSLLPINVARPGFDAKYKLIYKNKGNQVQSGTVGLTFNDATLDLVSANPVVSSQAVNSLSWNFANLNPFETREILITLNLNSSVETPPLNSGSVLNYTANITSAQTDETPNDNTFTLNQTVVNSFDPNDKTCLQGLTVGTDKVGDYAHYVIRFENSGTYNAQNITIKDVIDTNKFDINTLIPLSGSALFTTKISQGNKIEFLLENINLPYAAGTNTGYVAFKIKTKSTLVAGDTFGGLANIYFDYNSAITTNTYTTTIQALSVQDFSFVNYFSLYPNPVSEVLNISKKEDIEISSVHIYNMLGQLMMVVPNAKNTTNIDVSNLSSGNYFVKINSDKGTSNTKFIKK